MFDIDAAGDLPALFLTDQNTYYKILGILVVCIPTTMFAVPVSPISLQ